MPRQRAINPEFWVDDTLSNISLNARLFYIGTWNFSDDYGVIEFSLPKLKVQIFPYDDVKIQPLVEELVIAHRLIEFEAENKKWLYIKNFLKWQKVEKPSKKRNPVYLLPDSSPTIPLPVVSEVKRSKVKREGVETSSTSPTKDFFTDKDKQKEMFNWLLSTGIDEQLARTELWDFINYWKEPSLKLKNKERWELEKFFDIKRRIGSWLKNKK